MIRHCVICNKERSQLNQSEHGDVRGNTTRFKNQSFHLWKCPGCLTIHSLDPVDFADIYKDYPITDYQTLDLFARGRFQNLLKRLKQAGLSKHHNILDIGCGKGVFVDYLKSQGFTKAIGYDPYVQGFHKLNKEIKYDFLIANDVLEHVENPRATLQEWADLLASGGVLYVGTADSEFVKMNDLEVDRMLLHQPFHRVIITQKTLEALGRELNGFKLIKSYRRSYMDTWFPFVNYRFLDELNSILGHEIDRAMTGFSPMLFIKKPRLLFFGLFGYLFPSAAEPAIILKNK